MDMLTLEQTFLWFLLYSFVGWLWETVLNIVMKKRFVDRGILNGPLCPIYGFGALLAIVVLRGEHSLLVVFLTSGVLACTLEYVTSWGIEELFHMRLWDYSNKPFNINGRVYLNGFLFFGAGCTVVKTWVQPEVMRVLDAMPARVVAWLAWGLFVVLVADAAVTLAGLVSMRSRLGSVESDIKAWKQRQIGRMDVHITAADERLGDVADRLGVAGRSGKRVPVEARVQAGLEHAGTRVRDAVQERAEALAKAVHDRFSFQQRRWFDAFPQLRDADGSQAVAHVREQLDRYRRKGDR